MESAMEENSVGSGSVGDAMSIFGQNIDVRRPGKSRRRVTHKNLSSEIEEPARSSRHRLHRRKAIAAEERARAESELSRAMDMAKELKRQIEQTNAKARSHRSELRGTRARSRSTTTTTRGRPPGAADSPAHQESSSTVYSEVMEELDRVKAELRKLQHEVKVATAAKGVARRGAAASTSRVSSGSRVDDGVKREGGEGNEERGIVELAVGAEATRTRAKEIQGSTSSASDLEATATLATASSDAGIRHAELAVVGATEAAATTTRRHEEHESSSLQAAEAELNSARIEVESIKQEGLRFTTSIERTRKEMARVTDEISRLKEQEKKASAQVQQLNAKLVKARSRLEAVTAADERFDEIISNLTAMLRQLDDDIEGAEKEKALTEMENRCVRADGENVDAEIAAAEQRIRESVRELEAARASEAAATANLKAIVESAMHASAAEMSQRSGNVTIPRFEYEYLTGRAEVVRAVAEKKVAAAEAWAEARRAGEKEMIMRAEAIERELGESRTVEAEAVGGQDAAQQEPRHGVQRTRTSRRPVAVRGSGAPATSRRATSRRMPSSSPSVARKPRKRRVLILNCLKLIAGRCMGQN